MAMTILPLHQILPAINCLQLVSDNARSPVYAQSFAKRPRLDQRDPKPTNRWSSTATPRMKQLKHMPTLMSPRDEKFVKNDWDKRMALGAQAIRLPVRQRSRRNVYDTSLLPEKIGSTPVSPLVIPVRQLSSQRKQADQSQGLRIPIRQISQQCLLVKETEPSKDRRNNLSNHKKTTELLAQVLEDFSHMPIEEKGYKVDPFFI
ncbi:hypothetical protein FisN_8Lu279 [Fistulifera solaris]|uniref:Uncharacterized protein n=1 Tax=Fistulifera solaris TaxID=1519565 RepID=A0A1Z5JN67_FISSO|nr:hypothetical protein FisN_8Lu279 [Fistulifera solaris]|eukprot:GAX15460.1 hypothetical protein FisN_8Lu279 [Fistulifera solaris]